MSKYSGITEHNKAAFDAIVPKVKEAINKGEIPIPAGGTKLYLHKIVILGAKVIDKDTVGHPVVFKQSDIRIEYISTSSTPINNLELFGELAAGLNPHSMLDNMITIKDMRVTDTEYADTYGTLVYSYNEKGMSMKWWSGREETFESIGFSPFYYAIDEPDLFEATADSVNDTVTEL